MIGIGGLCDENDHKHTPDDSRDIRICQVRRMQHLVSRAPYEARYRVIIIEPADALGREATAALLKTLEEPPPYVVIILITDREEMLLDTIRSRARRVGFGGAPAALIERTLRTRWDVEPSRAAELARLSGGRLGWAVAALYDERMMEQRGAGARAGRGAGFGAAGRALRLRGAAWAAATRRIARACRPRWRCGRSGGATSC